MKLFRLFFAVFFVAANLTVASAKEPQVKNVIFMIGDGMGLAQLYAGMTESEAPLALEEFPFTGISKTYSANSYITDSAAGGTALACGRKTDNGMVGVLPDGTPIYSVLHILAQKGMVTGVVVTSSITDATPASFVAHQPKRSMHEEIAVDFLLNTPEIFVGGGRKYFDERGDNRNLLTELTGKGYDVADNLDELRQSKSSKIVSLLASDGMPSMLDKRGDMLPLATEKAIEVLSKHPKGFFLMVEGSQIDWQSHANKTEGVVAETIDFDNAVRKALDFARADGKTLVVVTADHETGGMSITGGSLAENQVKADFSTKGHSGIPVIVYAYGPGAENFSGIMENTSIKGKILDLMKIKE